RSRRPGGPAAHRPGRDRSGSGRWREPGPRRHAGNAPATPVAATARRGGVAAGTGHRARLDRTGQPPHRPPAAADRARPRAAALSAGDTAMQLVLASTSPYRRELLQRLRLPFDTVKPRVDETPLPDEEPVALVRRLALAKAAT